MSAMRGLRGSRIMKRSFMFYFEKDDFKNPFALTRLPDKACRYRKIWPGKTIRT
jgi:hypothetical protein